MNRIGYGTTIVAFYLLGTLSSSAVTLPKVTTVFTQPSSITIGKNFWYNQGIFNQPPPDTFYLTQNFPSPDPSSTAP